MKRLLFSFLLTTLMSPLLFATPVCSSLFEQPNTQFESLYYNLKGIVRDLGKDPLHEVWPRFSPEVERILVQQSMAESNDFYSHQMYVMLLTFKNIFNKNSARDVPAQLSLANEIIRGVAASGGMTFEFHGNIFYTNDSVQFVFRDVLGINSIAKGRFVGIREVGSTLNLVFELSPNNYIDIPMKNLISAKPSRL